MAEDRCEPLTPAEWKVIRIVWQLKKCAARNVYEETRRLFGWAPTTTKTVLARLVKKGYLSATQVGNSFLYRPARSALKTLTDAADALVEQFVEGTTGPVLAHLVKRSKLSGKELKELKALIDEQSRRSNGRSSTSPKREGE
jgi:predicted transcriptional regulator